MVDDFRSRGGSPWGSPPGGGGNGSGRGPRPPDIEEIIRKAQEGINKILPGGGSGNVKSLIVGAVIYATASFFAEVTTAPMIFSSPRTCSTQFLKSSAKSTVMTFIGRS